MTEFQKNLPDEQLVRGVQVEDPVLEWSKHRDILQRGRGIPEEAGSNPVL